MQYDDTSGATFWPNFELIQMVPPGDHVANSVIPVTVSCTMGPLNLFQCLQLILGVLNRTLSVPSHTLLRLSLIGFRLVDFFSEKIIAGPNWVPDPPSLAQMTFTQCTSMPELKFDSVATPGGQI